MNPGDRHVLDEVVVCVVVLMAMNDDDEGGDSSGINGRGERMRCRSKVLCAR